MRPCEQYSMCHLIVISLISYTCLRLFKLQSFTVHNLIYDFPEAQTKLKPDLLLQST